MTTYHIKQCTFCPIWPNCCFAPVVSLLALALIWPWHCPQFDNEEVGKQGTGQRTHEESSWVHTFCSNIRFTTQRSGSSITLLWMRENQFWLYGRNSFCLVLGFALDNVIHEWRLCLSLVHHIFLYFPAKGYTSFSFDPAIFANDIWLWNYVNKVV